MNQFYRIIKYFCDDQVLQKRCFWLIIVLANLILSFIVISDPLRAINADGVLYLKTAEAYLQNGWHAAMQQYPWPFYSVLIAWTSEICHCSLELAAYFIDIIFQILICIGFFNLACQLNSDENNINQSLLKLFATLVILFYPTFNHHRDLIIRDFGYWAFSLWGWFYLIRLNENQRYLNGIKFNVAMLLASLFRMEGIVILMFAPFAAFFNRQLTWINRLVVLLKAYSVTIILLIAALSYFYLYANKSVNFGRLLEIRAQIHSGISLIGQGLLAAKQHIATQVLTSVSIDSALPLLTGGLIAVYINMLIATLTLLYSILFGIAICKKQLKSIAVAAKVVLGIAIFLNLFITIIFLLQSLFLTQRYLFALSFLLLLGVPFALLWIYQHTRSQNRWLFTGTLVLMALIALISLHNFGPSKIYLREAGGWVHSNLPEQEKIYTNSPQLSFYIHHPAVTWQNGVSAENISDILQDVRQKKYAYLVIQVKGNDILFKQRLNDQLPQPIKMFKNNKNDVVLIYKIGNYSHPVENRD